MCNMSAATLDQIQLKLIYFHRLSIFKLLNAKLKTYYKDLSVIPSDPPSLNRGLLINTFIVPLKDVYTIIFFLT